MKHEFSTIPTDYHGKLLYRGSVVHEGVIQIWREPDPEMWCDDEYPHHHLTALLGKAVIEPDAYPMQFGNYGDHWHIELADGRQSAPFGISSYVRQSDQAGDVTFCLPGGLPNVVQR
jgi:hypothetical protein